MTRKFNTSETVEIGKNTILVCRSQMLIPANYCTLNVCTNRLFKFEKLQLKLSSSKNEFCKFWQTFPCERKKTKNKNKTKKQNQKQKSAN